MGFEIDFLPVGDGEKSGDAIALRFGNLYGNRSEQTVITIDGGTLESGDALVDHIGKYYGTDTVDIAILSHPDTDHASGMRRVLERMVVRQVLMHLPWEHSSHVKALLDDHRITVSALEQKAKKTLKTAKEVFDLAVDRGIPVIEPFAGGRTANGLIVLGPTQDYYRETLANFEFMPGSAVSSAYPTLVDFLKLAAKEAVCWLQETWTNETLQDPAEDATSARNNSSVVFLLEVDSKKLLFTGDAGVPALTRATDFAGAMGISLAGIVFFQVPHHGSRKNLGRTILNRIFGGIRADQSQDWTALISAAPEGEPKHPHKKVTNALRRRGASVHTTAGHRKLYSHNSPGRDGWSGVAPIPFYESVEDDD